MQKVRHDIQLANPKKDRLKMSGRAGTELVQKHNGALALIEKKLFGP